MIYSIIRHEFNHAFISEKIHNITTIKITQHTKVDLLIINKLKDNDTKLF